MATPCFAWRNFFPSDQLVDFAAALNQERADSLKVRFDQEEQLIERASQRFLLGWGRYGRSRVYEDSGKDSSLTDGFWIITFGQFGIIGFLAQFGLLSLPVFRSLAAIRQAGPKHETVFLGALVLIATATVVEQLPNASITPWSWLLAGALLGRIERIQHAKSRTRPLVATPHTQTESGHRL